VTGQFDSLPESIDSGNQNHGPVGTEANGAVLAVAIEVTRGRKAHLGGGEAWAHETASEVINGEVLVYFL